MQTGSGVRGFCCGVLLACIAVSAYAEGELYLRSGKTGRRYGPFKMEHGHKIMLGASEFIIEIPPSPPVAPASETPAPGVDSATPAEQAALDSANSWLKLIDAEDHGQAWETMASFAKDSVKKADFADTIRRVQDALGKVKSREVTRMDHATSLPAAPDGHYMIITYASRMARKHSAAEVVVALLDSDGRWRISGYTVR